MITISQPPPEIVTRARIKTGTYTGNGGDNRDIDIGVNLAAKSNVYVILKIRFGGDTWGGKHRIEYGQGDLAMHFEALDDVADYIQSFSAIGFVVGTLGNQDTKVYRYIVFWEEP